jgi:hypothetical protein
VRHQLLPCLVLTGIEQFFKSMSIASFEGVPLQDIHFCRLDLSKSLYATHKFWVGQFARHSHLQPRLCLLAILHVSHNDSCGSLSFTVLRGYPGYKNHCERHEELPINIT